MPWQRAGQEPHNGLVLTSCWLSEAITEPQLPQVCWPLWIVTQCKLHCVPEPEFPSKHNIMAHSQVTSNFYCLLWTRLHSVNCLLGILGFKVLLISFPLNNEFKKNLWFYLHTYHFLDKNDSTVEGNISFTVLCKCVQLGAEEYETPTVISVLEISWAVINRKIFLKYQIAHLFTLYWTRKSYEAKE